MTDKKNTAATALHDQDLDEVTGGLDYVEVKSTGKYYKWRGNDNQDGQKFLCPNCGRPVHYGAWMRYYCDPCNESWLYESKLVPNIASGLWHEIPEFEYRLWTEDHTF